MSWHCNYRRVFPTWARAAEISVAWSWQSGLKHRIRRVRDGVYRVQLASGPRRYGWDPRAGAFRMMRRRIMIDVRPDPDTGRFRAEVRRI